MNSVVIVPLVFTVLAVEPAADVKCTCPTAKIKNGWCGSCKLGYVASVKINSYMLFEALDPHGHEINPKSITCPSCHKALKTDGYCSVCQWGFVDEQLYFSKLTYYQAKGQAKDTSKIACASCKQNAAKYGWCEKCKTGMVGNMAYLERKDYEHAAKQYDLLLEAIKTSQRCESCAVSMFYGATCRQCNISYKDGKKITPPAPKLPAGSKD